MPSSQMPQMRHYHKKLLVPRRISPIIPRRALDNLLALLGSNILNLLGRDTSIERVGLKMLVREDKSIGGNNAPCADNSIVENCSSHAYKAVVLDDSTMNNGIMTYGYIVANMGLRGVLRTIVEGVDDNTILDICMVANGDGINIATQHSIVPYRAVLTYGDIAYYGGILGQPRVVTNLRLVASNFSYKCHSYSILFVF